MSTSPEATQKYPPADRMRSPEEIGRRIRTGRIAAGLLLSTIVVGAGLAAGEAISSGVQTDPSTVASYAATGYQHNSIYGGASIRVEQGSREQPTQDTNAAVGYYEGGDEHDPSEVNQAPHLDVDPSEDFSYDRPVGQSTNANQPIPQ